MALESKFGKIYQALKAHILAQVPEIKWVDLDLGQLEIYQQRPAVAFPCVLIDFPDTQYREKQLGFQHGEPQISFKLGFPPFTQTSSTAPVAVAEMGLQFFELEHKLFLALQDFNPGPDLNVTMVRMRAVSQLRDDEFRVRIIYYKGVFQDNY